MIVEEVSASIVCSKCNYGFDYSALGVHTKVEDIHKYYLKNNLGACDHCEEGKLIIRDVKCVLKAKQVYTIRWECKECGTKWAQTEYISRDNLTNKTLLKMLRRCKSDVVCPYISCTSTKKKLLGMSKG